MTFESLGLDARLLRSLNKKSITKPTPIQSVAIPLFLQGKDVVARAKTGSGKTFVYLLPLVQKILKESDAKRSVALSSIVLVPTRGLCQQVGCRWTGIVFGVVISSWLVHVEITSLVELCRVSVKVVQLTSSMSNSDLKTAVSGQPDVIILTPACANVLVPRHSSGSSHSSITLDLLLSYGYEDDLKALTAHVPRSCQCLLMSATSSGDVEKLRSSFCTIHIS
ncbi:DEAD-box ATP-dependent RNA helicase 16-like protein [Drosera capensis]